MRPEQNIDRLSIVAEIELIYRPKVKATDRPIIRKSEDIYQLLINHWNFDTIELQEEFKVLLLNNACRVLGIYYLSKGSIVSTVADPKLIFAAALKAKANKIILAHNHPSGDTTPSVADLNLTRKIKAGCELLDISLLDHLIITPDRYFSFTDGGLL